MGCCLKKPPRDTKSDEVRKLVGESADSIDQFRDILHSSYAPGLAALSAANHAAAESTKYLNMQEKAEVKVAMAQLSNHFKALETEFEEYSELLADWGDYREGQKGADLYRIPWYKEQETSVETHDKTWLHLCKMQEDFEKVDRDTPQEDKDSIKKQFAEADDDYNKSCDRMEGIIRTFRTQKAKAFRHLLSDIIQQEMALHMQAMERLTDLAQRAVEIPTDATAPSSSGVNSTSAAPVSAAASTAENEVIHEGRYKPWLKQPADFRDTHRRLPAFTANMLRTLPHRFGETMTLAQVDCVLRELVYEMPFSAEGISTVSHRIFTIFAIPQHALARLGAGRHPGADKPGTLRTADMAVGLATIITEGDLQDRMRNAFDVHDAMGIGRVDRQFMVGFLQILSKHVPGKSVIEPIVEQMFVPGKGDLDFDGTLTFKEMWNFTDLPNAGGDGAVTEMRIQVYDWMSLYAHHLGAMLGEGQLGYLYIKQLRRQPQSLVRDPTRDSYTRP